MLRAAALRLALVPGHALTRVIDTVLFDLDDTLHDDTGAYQRAAQRVADELGRAHGIDGARIYSAYVEQANGFWTKLSSEHLDVDDSRRARSDVVRRAGRSRRARPRAGAPGQRGLRPLSGRVAWRSRRASSSL